LRAGEQPDSCIATGRTVMASVVRMSFKLTNLTAPGAPAIAGETGHDQGASDAAIRQSAKYRARLRSTATSQTFSLSRRMTTAICAMRVLLA
jgi:hypothetical protein